MVDVIAQWDGRSIAALRLALRLTWEDFAEHLGVATRAVAKWQAQPNIVPTLATQQLLDITFARAPDDARRRFDLLLTEASAAPPKVSVPAQATRTATAAPNVGGPSGGLRLATPDTLTYLRQTLHSHYTADNLLGPRVLLPVIVEHVRAIDQLRRGANGSTLDELLRVGAGYAEFAGWLSQDSGDMAGAAAWCDRALEWAQAGGDDRMASFVMTRRAVQSLSRQDGAYAIRLAAAGQRYRGGDTARVRALAALTEATGHAITGDRSETDRAIDTAADVLSSAPEVAEGDPTQGRYCELDLYLEITRAKCYLELGRADDAIGAFGVVLDNLPSDYHRDRGQYLARMARAYVMSGQPEAASSAASESLSIALATGSSRTVADLRSLPGSLAQWQHLPEVDQFCAMLAGVESPTANGGN